jgi:hypothetical protein
MKPLDPEQSTFEAARAGSCTLPSSMSDNDTADTPEFVSRILERFRGLRDKADAALAECRALREEIVRTMRERRDDPMWPDNLPSLSATREVLSKMRAARHAVH